MTFGIIFALVVGFWLGAVAFGTGETSPALFLIGVPMMLVTLYVVLRVATAGLGVLL